VAGADWPSCTSSTPSANRPCTASTSPRRARIGSTTAPHGLLLLDPPQHVGPGELLAVADARAAAAAMSSTWNLLADLVTLSGAANRASAAGMGAWKW